jgi:hypothetical protein
MVIMMLTTGSFLIREIFNIVRFGVRDYFRFEKWNIIDILCLSVIFTGLIAEAVGADFRAVHEIFSIGALLLWIKSLYYMRIFRTTAGFIRMVTEVIYDIRYFLFIIFVVVFAFSHAFAILAINESAEDDPAEFA